MPWKGVTVSEQRQRFLQDYLLSYYSITELADRFSISRTTAHKWINRYKQYGQNGFHEALPAPTQLSLADRQRHRGGAGGACGSDIPAGVRASCWT